MPRKNPSPQQQKLLDARAEKPGATTEEIAEVLGITTSAVYQSESRMREQGHLPKLRKAHYGRGRKARVRVAAASSTQASRPAEGSKANANGRVPTSVEDHLRAELESGAARIIELEENAHQIAEELATLRERQGKLSKAQEALVAAA